MADHVLTLYLQVQMGKQSRKYIPFLGGDSVLQIPP
jgi:hypothetical protein